MSTEPKKLNPDEVRKGQWKYWAYGNEPNIHRMRGRREPEDCRVFIERQNCGCLASFIEGRELGLATPAGHKACKSFPTCGWPEQAAKSLAQLIIDTCAYTPKIGGADGGQHDESDISDTPVRVRDGA